MILFTANVISQVGFNYLMPRDTRKPFVNTLRRLLQINLRRKANPLKRFEVLSFLFSDLRESKRAMIFGLWNDDYCSSVVLHCR